MNPKPGIYEVTPEEYFSWDAVSNSRLSLLAKSPKHYKHGFKASTNAMRLGTLVHNGVLEPLAIIQRYAVIPDYSSHPDNKTAAGARSWSSSTGFVKQMEEQFRTLNFDKLIVGKEEYDRMIGMAGAIAECKTASELFRDGQAELSIVWEDASGFLCKARIDWLKNTKRVMVDLKTTLDAASFEKSMASYGYHRQMAFYRRGLETLGFTDVVPWVVAVDKEAPYGVRAAPISEDALAVGRREVEHLLGVLVECSFENKWPGYESPREWNLPAWYSEKGDAMELVIAGESVSV